MLSFLFLIISFVTARTIENSWKELEKQIGEKHLMNTFIIANVQWWIFVKLVVVQSKASIFSSECVYPLRSGF